MEVKANLKDDVGQIARNDLALYKGYFIFEDWVILQSRPRNHL